MSATNYQQQRIDLGDGNWSICHSLTIPAAALSFEDLHPKSSYLRQQEIARMHYARAKSLGDAAPRILTWSAMQTDRRAADMFPGLDYTLNGETIISANAFITGVLRHLLAQGWLRLHEFVGDTYEWRADVPADEPLWQARAAALIGWLERSIDLDLYPNIERGSYQTRLFDDFDAARHFIRVGRCDFVRHFVQHHERAAAFNTSHFLHEHDDLGSHHSGYGDAVGLMLAAGAILRPPLYRRGCLLFDSQSWTMRRLCLDDIAMILPGEICLRADDQGDYRFALNPRHTASPVAVYNRACGIGATGRPLEHTPIEWDRVEFLIVNRQVVSQKRGGGLQLPQNGFALSLAADAMPEAALDQIAADAWIEYEFADDSDGFFAGIQAGPILLRDGKIALDESAIDEEFFASQVIDGERVVGITPVNLRRAAIDERKARSALGIKADGDLLLLLVDGCDKSARTPYDSAGATLNEMARWLRERGAVDALNLSGEGSAHLFVSGGLANRPSDRRGAPGVVYERMLASIGIVSLV